jgi:hypothetical protein
MVICTGLVPTGSARTISHKIKTKRPTAFELLDKYTKALDSTFSFIDHYEKSTKFNNRFQHIQARRTNRGKKFERGQVRHDDQRFYYQSYTWGDVNPRLRDIPKDAAVYHCHIVDGKEKKTYQHYRTANLLGKAGRFPKVTPQKVVLSRHFGVSYIVGYIGSDERLDAILRKADNISVRKTTENVGGSECFVIDADTKCGRYSVWLDPEHGFHSVKVRRRAKGGGYTHSRLMSKGETALTYLDTVRFEKVDGLWVPMEADAGCDRIMPSGDFVKEDYHYKRTQIILNPNHDKLGSFADPIFEDPNNDPELENGTRVTINFLPTRYTWQNGQVVDEKGQKVDLEKLIRLKVKKPKPKRK